MALQAAYKQFLASPNSSALADDASLHYVTTTTSFAGAADIVKHLSSLRNKIKKVKQEPLFAVENQHALALEVDTTLEFLTSGGPYLPGLEDNFLADRTVHIAVTHIVTFHGDGKISQIRQSWDQGALLKQVEVIGRSGANWPIRDGKDQISLIAKCAKGDAAAAAAAAETREPAERIVRPDPDKSASEKAEPPAPKGGPDRKGIHGSSWSFDDFTTPQKPVAMRGAHRARDVRHWGPDNELLDNTPARNPHPAKPRRDAEAHFELADDGPEPEERRNASRAPRGAAHNDSRPHLYETRLRLGDDDSDNGGDGDGDRPAPPAKIAGRKDRHKDFEPHFEMTDESPRHTAPAPPARLPEDRKKAVRMMTERSWTPYDDDNDDDEPPASRKGNGRPSNNNNNGGGGGGSTERGIAIAGDGMGGRKGTARNFLCDDDGGGDGPEPLPASRRGVRGPPAKSDNFWDF
ncbi:hypothetical protein VTH06DRAFT_492 [Thermothelomyces fergusii]